MLCLTTKVQHRSTFCHRSVETISPVYLIPSNFDLTTRIKPNNYTIKGIRVNLKNHHKQNLQKKTHTHRNVKISFFSQLQSKIKTSTTITTPPPLKNIEPAYGH